MSGAKAPDFDAYGWRSTKINAPSNSKYNIYYLIFTIEYLSQ